jgi:hypothetical protein
MHTRRRFGIAVLAVAALALLLAGAGQARAGAIWTLDQVTTSGNPPFFSGEPGSLTGSFEYDASTNTYSNILITHTPNSVEPTDLTFSTFISGDANSLSLDNGPPNPDGSIGRHSLLLQFSTPLTDAGGTVPLSGGHTTLFSGIRGETITGGSVVAAPTATAVPEPASLTVFGICCLALLGYGWRRRKQAA